MEAQAEDREGAGGAPEGDRVTLEEVVASTFGHQVESLSEWFLRMHEEAILDTYYEQFECPLVPKPTLLEIDPPVVQVVECSLCHLEPLQVPRSVDGGGGPGPFTVKGWRVECPRCHSHTSCSQFESHEDFVNQARLQWNLIHEVSNIA